ncbi:MAG: hypothetical protein LKM39_07455 [Chiayiivirga sp.]|jgi:hypothetical protein|nr:hypothetical protein [Chiayiivirga sp.]
MLSKNAFNALLKTLEEPPEHVKFLLATTDPQKLPVTVLSRCLQFNLKRLTEEQIAAQMTRSSRPKHRGRRRLDRAAGAAPTAACAMACRCSTRHSPSAGGALREDRMCGRCWGRWTGPRWAASDPVASAGAGLRNGG